MAYAFNDGVAESVDDLGDQPRIELDGIAC